MSFFDLTPPRLRPTDAMPGISASEEDFLALIDALRTTLDAFQDTHPDLTYGDCFHAVTCLQHEIVSDYTDYICDA